MSDTENNEQISGNEVIPMNESKHYGEGYTGEMLNKLDEAENLIEQADTDKLFGENYARLLYEDFNNMRNKDNKLLKANILIVDDDEGIRGGTENNG